MVVDKENRAKVAVHLHLYYTDMWAKIADSLSNLDVCDWDLFVTLTQSDALLSKRILEFFPQAKIFVVENRGFDVGPFIYFLHQIDLSDYDFVLKLHTKNDKSGCDSQINKYWLSREMWTSLMYQSLISDRRTVLRNLHLFDKDADCGMIASRYLITSDFGASKNVCRGVLSAMKNLTGRYPSKITFAAGTMFAVRAKLLEPIKNAYSLQDFALSDSAVKDGTLAHVLERVFGCMVVAQGYKIKGSSHNWKFETAQPLKRLKHFVWNTKTTAREYRLVKICRIPVYHRRVIK